MPESELATVSPNRLRDLPAKGTRTKGRKQVRVEHALSFPRARLGGGDRRLLHEKTQQPGAPRTRHLPCKALWKATGVQAVQSVQPPQAHGTPPNLSGSPAAPQLRKGSPERNLNRPRTSGPCTEHCTTGQARTTAGNSPSAVAAFWRRPSFRTLTLKSLNPRDLERGRYRKF